MSLWRLALNNIKGSAFRSAIIFACVLGISAFLLGTTLVIPAQNSLNVGIERLGADILVVPEGAETKIETALLMGKPTSIWMPESKLDEIAAIPGVHSLSPQIYLQSLYGAACCAVSEMFLVVYDPATDFTLKTWLDNELGRPLALGEVIGGDYIFVPPEEEYICIYGYNTTLVGNLGATGTGIDQTLFMSRETAEAMVASSLSTAVTPLMIPQGEISEIIVKIVPGADRHKVALDILLNVLGVVPLESPNLFGQFRHQMTGLLWGFVAIMVTFWVLAAVLIALVFSMAAAKTRNRRFARHWCHPFLRIPFGAGGGRCISLRRSRGGSNHGRFLCLSVPQLHHRIAGHAVPVPVPVPVPARLPGAVRSGHCLHPSYGYACRLVAGLSSQPHGAGHRREGVSMIELKNVTKEFNLDEQVIAPVREVTLNIAKGEFIIIGRLGTGKSTMLNLVAGLIKPTSGSSQSMGENWRGCPMPRCRCCVLARWAMSSNSQACCPRSPSSTT